MGRGAEKEGWGSSQKKEGVPILGDLLTSVTHEHEEPPKNHEERTPRKRPPKTSVYFFGHFLLFLVIFGTSSRVSLTSVRRSPEIGLGPFFCEELLGGGPLLGLARSFSVDGMERVSAHPLLCSLLSVHSPPHSPP